jgi:DNA replication protein DnaC
MIQQTFDQLRDLRLIGCVLALKEQLDNPDFQQLSFDERLAMIVEREHVLRHNRRMERNLRQAKLKQQASLEEVDFEVPRGLKRAQLLELTTGAWIERHQNLFITGPTGVGKTFIACALAERVVRLGKQALYIKTSDLVTDAAVSRADGSYTKFAIRLARTPLLVLDEWLRDPLDQTHARNILDILDDRYQTASTIFLSQIPVKLWHQSINDATIADAILDRICHNAHKIELNGESMRKSQNRSKSADGLTGGSLLRSDIKKIKNKKN